MSKQNINKRKILDMKDKIRIIEAFDEKVKKEGKVNKAQFAAPYGLTKSSFGTILSQRPFSIWPYQGGQTLPIHGGVLKYHFYLIYIEPQYKVHFDITYFFPIPQLRR